MPRPAPTSAAPARTARASLLALPLAAVFAATGCSGGHPGPHHGALPETATPCASMSSGPDRTPSGTPRDTSSPAPSPTREPLQTKLAWRADELHDGSVRMTVGDVDKAPKDPEAVRVTDYRAPGSRIECENVKVVPVHGWWCATTVSRVAVHGEIVVGGARPRAHIRSAGFRTHCSDRTARMRQSYTLERDSWSGWRSYARTDHTAWTSAQDQAGPEVSSLCPRGRVGTYNYRLAVAVEVDTDGPRTVPSYAASREIRTDCGTGVS